MKKRWHDFVLRCIPLVICFVLMTVDVFSQVTLAKLSVGGWAYRGLLAFCWGGALGSLAFILGRCSRWIYFPLFLFLLLNGIAETYVRWQFGCNYCGDWILILQASSPAELYNYWCENKWLLMGIFVALSVAAIIVVKVTWLATYPKFSMRNIVLGVIFLLPMVIFSWVGHYPKGHVFGAAIFHRVVTDTFANISMFSDLGTVVREPKGLDDVQLTVPLDQAPTCVIVIGESATRNSFGIYGYERDTTPYLSSIKDDLQIFTDLVGVWNNTPPAVRFLFTGATAEDKVHARMMIAQAVKKAGYPQTFVSNQGRWGSMNNVITLIFNSADQCVFLEDQQLSKPYYDDAMLPYLKKALADRPTSGQVVYLHQVGSHFPFKGLYPKKRTVFTGGRTIDHYDNTVCLTDYFIGEIINELKALHRPAMLFYVSDHGDTPRAKSWRQSNDLDLWELPMFVWFSEEYKRRFPDTVRAVRASLSLPLQSDQILPGLLLMLQVNGWSDSMSEKCFLNPDFVPRQCRLIKNWSEPYDCGKHQ